MFSLSTPRLNKLARFCEDNGYPVTLRIYVEGDVMAAVSWAELDAGELGIYKCSSRLDRLAALESLEDCSYAYLQYVKHKQVFIESLKTMKTLT